MLDAVRSQMSAPLVSMLIFTVPWKLPAAHATLDGNKTPKLSVSASATRPMTTLLRYVMICFICFSFAAYFCLLCLFPCFLFSSYAPQTLIEHSPPLPDSQRHTGYKSFSLSHRQLDFGRMGLWSNGARQRIMCQGMTVEIVALVEKVGAIVRRGYGNLESSVVQFALDSSEDQIPL